MKTLGWCMAAGLGLSACASGMSGGAMGNSDPDINSNEVVTQYPIETAMLNIYTKESSETLTAMMGNQRVSADIIVTPKGSMRFNNKAVQGAEVNTITKSNNQIINQSVAINYFTVNPLVFHGFTESSGEYSLAKQTSSIPKMATIGDSAKLITEDVYSDSSRRKKIGTYQQDWSLTRANNNSAWFCINTSANLLLSYDPEGSSSECYKINARGDILDSKVTLQIPTANSTLTVTFTRT